ncbi:MAG: hypothetical protein ACRD1F_10815, partial [Terriglobales bacterium]
MLLGLLAGACSTVAAHSAAPQVLLVTGGNELEAINIQDLQLRAQLRLPGPVVAAALDTHAHRLLLATSGKQPYWLAIGGGGQSIVYRHPLAFLPAAMIMHGQQGYLAGQRGTGSLVQPFTGNHFAIAWPLPGRAVAMARTPQGLLALATTQ